MRELQVVDAAELAAAYAAADYGVLLENDELRLRVDQVASDLEAYWPVGRYTFITAWNPASEPHSEAANEAADALLIARLDAAGVSRQAAWSQGQEGEWREAGWLLADVENEVGDRLAREFGQAGILSWQRGDPVRLRMLLPKPAGVAKAAHIEWAG